MFEHIMLECSSLTPERIGSAARDSIARHRLAYLRGFPLEVETYISLLETLGDPCPNYAASSTKEAYRLHPVVNVVRCQPAPADGVQRVQEKSGALVMHTGRSFARRRPRHLAMLMADPGWTDFEPGRNGESLIVRWGDVLLAMRERFPAQWIEDLRVLTSYAIGFPASHLDEACSELPLLYVPGTPGPAGPAFDVAARLPQDLGRLRSAAERIKDGDRWFEAVERFAATANDPAVQHRYEMRAGDVVIIDNDRYGHGRCEVVATRPGDDGAQVVNARTIWSVNIE